MDDFEQFVVTRSGALMGTAILLTGDRYLAEDLLQASLVKAWRTWQQVHTSHEGFVRRIMVNLYVTWWRRRWNGELPSESLPEASARSGAADESMDLWRAVCALPRRQRAVVVLRYYEDLPDAEIASLLDCAVGTVKSQAHRALPDSPNTLLSKRPNYEQDRRPTPRRVREPRRRLGCRQP